MRILALITVLLLGIVPAIAAEQTLAERHKNVPGNCAACHEQEGKPPASAKCQSCHGSYDELGSATTSLQPNPHQSHVADLECIECHHGHKEFTLYCTNCHSEMKIIRKEKFTK